MTNERIEYYCNATNRCGFNNFIEDRDKIAEIYEDILKIEDDSFIDMMDHFVIATTLELGVKKEQEILELKKRISELEELK